MTDQTPTDPDATGGRAVDHVVAPELPQGGAATKLATAVSSRGNDPDPDASPGGAVAGIRLAVLLGVLALVGLLNPWMLVVILCFVVMITLHELGHYVMAKRAGMKVTEFFLGFGPKIWSTRRGETEYGIKAIPAGAYVKIPGMVNLDEVPAADEGRTYRQKTFRQRVGVAVAGSTMHFLLAIALIYVALVAVGQPGGTILPEDEDHPPVLGTVFAGSGADEAGLEAGDRVTKLDGSRVDSAKALIERIGASKGSSDPISIEVERDGATRTVEAEIRPYTVPKEETELQERAEQSCGLGIRVAEATTDRVDPVTGLGRAPKEFGEVLWLSTKGLGSFFSPGGIKSFAGQVGSAQDDRKAAEADDDKDESVCAPAATSGSARGGTGENRVMSIVGIVQFGSDTAAVDPAALIVIFGLINIFIGVFNLVPLLPFDGGHVAIAVYEKVQEKRLRRRRYFADVSRLLPLTYVVVFLLGALFLSSLYLDIVNPIG